MLPPWSVLTRKWDLLALPFKRLCSNYLNRDNNACSRDPLTSSTFLADIWDIWLSAKFAVSVLLRMKNKSAKKMLNKYGPSIGPLGTPNIIVSYSL